MVSRILDLLDLALATVNPVKDSAPGPLASLQGVPRPSSGEPHSAGGTGCRSSSAGLRNDACAALEMACAPCVARPLALPDRVAAMQAAIGAETEPLVTLTHLLQLCRDEHPVLWERLNDPASGDKVAVIASDVRAVLPAALSTSVLDPRVRGALSAALTADDDVPAVVVARALAELLDDVYSHSFAASFRRRSPYQPGVGDPIPLDRGDIPVWRRKRQ